MPAALLWNAAALLKDENIPGTADLKPARQMTESCHSAADQENQLMFVLDRSF